MRILIHRSAIVAKLNDTPILIPHIDLPFHWSRSFNHIEVWLTLAETEDIMKELGTGTHSWGEPTDYKCANSVVGFLGQNLALAQEIRLAALGLYPAKVFDS